MRVSVPHFFSHIRDTRIVVTPDIVSEVSDFNITKCLGYNIRSNLRYPWYPEMKQDF